ncbi:hypothetical protein M378DRAFT_165388 [Amanita muscaria Koide BX008]|uniref:Uncharacterized protein n=1 Tax=Amanita muscaria (strain Koide BX008) TaxID=946122 RepID=A0A0C2WMC6_AMAMK|nr:hypothetical protein M378DRAFT_165388 [Amanita muscaria Koide BX008]
MHCNRPSAVMGWPGPYTARVAALDCAVTFTVFHSAEHHSSNNQAKRGTGQRRGQQINALCRMRTKARGGIKPK